MIRETAYAIMPTIAQLKQTARENTTHFSNWLRHYRFLRMLNIKSCSTKRYITNKTKAWRGKARKEARRRARKSVWRNCSLGLWLLFLTVVHNTLFFFKNLKFWSWGRTFFLLLFFLWQFQPEKVLKMFKLSVKAKTKQ